MDNQTEIEPWPEPVDAEELLKEIAQEFDTFPKAIRTLAPLWVFASYCGREFTPPEKQRYTLRKMLVAVPAGDRQRFLLLLRGMVHPQFRPLLDHRLAELPNQIRGN
jgi:hypothetical protein